MKYEWLDAYCLSKQGAEKDYKVEWEVTRYMIGGKMFAMVGDNKQKRPIVTLKCAPEFGELLRQAHEDIAPGYYMNKLHWNSVDLNGDVPDETVREMIDMSYELILHGLTKAAQKSILEAAAI